MNARTLLNELREVATSGKGLDELMVLSTQAQALRNTYEAKGVPVPEWLDETNRTLNGRIAELNRDILEARLREITQAEEALKTPGERRAALATERQRLEQMLGKKAEAPEAVGATQ